MSAASRKRAPNNERTRCTDGVPGRGGANFRSSTSTRLIKPFARFRPGMATIKHRGRKSGKPSTKPSSPRTARATCWRSRWAHGKTDWVKNVLAAGRGRRAHRDRDSEHGIVRSPEPACRQWRRRAAVHGQGAVEKVGVFVADIDYGHSTASSYRSVERRSVPHPAKSARLRFRSSVRRSRSASSRERPAIITRWRRWHDATGVRRGYWSILGLEVGPDAAARVPVRRSGWAR